jgi:hypothetical protein
MEPLAVDLHLLSELRGPALRLTPGRALMARVMQADGSGQGQLNIAGAVIEAALPRHLRAGQQLRLVVRKVDSRRVVLEMPHTPAATPQTPPVQLPGGGALRVLPDPGDGGGGQTGGGQSTSTLALSYDTPALGTLDLRFELDAGGLRVVVIAPAGQPLDLATARAQSLQAALEQTGDRPASVSVVPRREHLDLYA